jgi:hypothetical protein
MPLSAIANKRSREEHVANLILAPQLPEHDTGERTATAAISQGQGWYGGTIHSKDHLAHPSQRGPKGKEVAELWFQ